jgi:HEPN domain-containing protein
MSAERVIAGHLKLAQEDLEAARLLSSQGNRYAIYHCEQAVEKIIRAVLTAEGKHAGIRHDLGEMVGMIPEANPVKHALRELEFLAAYATSYRYPSVVGKIAPAPPRATLDESTIKVEAVLRTVAAAFKVDFAKPDAPAGNSAPIR